jgi:hypothetical protein
MENKPMSVRFAAINRTIEESIVKPTEKVNTGSMDYVIWGNGNNYPDYLDMLYDEVPTLKTCINGLVDYVCGNDIVCKFPIFNGTKLNQRQSGSEVIRSIAEDEARYGGFAFQVIRSIDGTPAEVYYMPLNYVRTNKDRDVFFYSEDWGKKNVRKDRVLIYPAFDPTLDWKTMDEEARKRHLSSILFVTNTSKHTYPSSVYSASVKACEMERRIDDFHLNALENNFAGNIIVNFNNGTPEDAVKDEIEKLFTEKFTGSSNAGRVGFSWNDSKENAMTIEQVAVEDFGEKYNSLEKRARQQIFTAFRANPNLFGIPTDNLGFSSEEYEASFKLFNRTMVQPIQKDIAEALEKIFGTEVVTFVPFNMDEGSKETVVN